MSVKEHKLNFEAQRAVWANEQYIAKNEFDLHVEELVRNGYTILENCLMAADVEYVRNKIDEIYAIQVAEFGGEDALIEIGEQGLARNLFEYSEYFLEIIVFQEVLSLVRHFLGEYFTLFQCNGNMNIPKLPATSTPWHRDITFRDFTSSRPISMTATWVIDGFKEENGGITILPGSHRNELFPSFEFAEKYQKNLFVKEGSVIVVDGMVFHRSGFNNSGGPRRICQSMYTLPFMGQQICIPLTLREKYQDDPFLRQFLGYNNIQQASVYDWRKEKLDNKRKNLKVV